MSIFHPGRAILNEVASAASEEILFTPQNGAATAIRARIGEKLFKTAQGNVPVNMLARRFIVFLADLPGFPSKGDTIAWNGRTYKLAHPDGGPVWRWHGNDGTSIAIYAIDFGTAP